MYKLFRDFVWIMTRANKWSECAHQFWVIELENQTTKNTICKNRHLDMCLLVTLILNSATMRGTFEHVTVNSRGLKIKQAWTTLAHFFPS